MTTTTDTASTSTSSLTQPANQKHMFISEIVETFQDGDSKVEVCATADTHYDSPAKKVSVALESFLRQVTGSDANRPRPSWLPPAEQVTEHLSSNEAVEFTKDVFQSWVKKVRTGIPSTLRSHV